jgi:hypothetical protein
MKRQKDEKGVNEDIVKAEAVANKASNDEAAALAKARADA